MVQGETSTHPRLVPCKTITTLASPGGRPAHNSHGHFHGRTLCSESCPSEHGLDPTLFQCWPTAYGAGPTSKQHWVKSSCLPGFYVVTSFSVDKNRPLLWAMTRFLGNWELVPGCDLGAHSETVIEGNQSP